MIVDSAIYGNGQRETVTGDISDALDAARVRGDCFIWIAMHEPTHEEFDLVKDELHLHPLAVEDAVKAHQRPKLERYDDSIFVVLKTVHYIEATSDIEVGEIMVFVGGDFVITVRHGERDPLGPVRRRLEAEPDLLARGPSSVLYGVCDLVVDTYGTVAHSVEVDIIALERRVFRPHRGAVTEDIYALKREVLAFRAAEDPLIPAVEEIAKGKVKVCAATIDYFRDVLNHLLRVDAMVDSHNELLTNVLSAHLALVGAQQNEDMRKISAWAAIFAVPTMVAGIYGMNFEHMPELHWTFGYPFIFFAIAVACAYLFRRFKRSGWL
ncbi:MAG TPA: magnesium/cobalt transporter CorA [Streptosporangiaceae bacterium]|nr:magnesium/cobalt transporter CorA [Streptosporangiaceae bacterium]